MTGKIHSIETFGTVDGPGIRYVVFMQGCPMRCAYCHNPDTWQIDGGKEYTVQELLNDISKYTRYIEGVTVSGGEPLMQIGFVIELFKHVKEMGLTTCLDTSGIVFDKSNSKLIEQIDELLLYCDLVLLDIKHIDEDSHISLTGMSNKNVLKFAEYVDSRNIEMWLRYVLVPGINDSYEILTKWKNFAIILKNVKKIEVLPYHRLGVEKYKKLGINYGLEGVQEPSKESIDMAKKILEIKGENDD